MLELELEDDGEEADDDDIQVDRDNDRHLLLNTVWKNDSINIHFNSRRHSYHHSLGPAWLGQGGLLGF